MKTATDRADLKTVQAYPCSKRSFEIFEMKVPVRGEIMQSNVFAIGSDVAAAIHT